MSKKGYPDTIDGWEKLLEAVKRHEKDLPGADSLRDSLELRLQESVEAKHRQDLHRSGRQRATRDLGQSMAAGRDVASRLCCLVKSVYGPRDERLQEFGMTPVKPRCRKPPPEKVNGSPGYH
ncbi:MAG TPA: hypothetical protein VIC28_02655 [Thermoanaerobaculia bacterium]|jgi:hypothetical protein